VLENLEAHGTRQDRQKAAEIFAYCTVCKPQATFDAASAKLLQPRIFVQS